MNNQHSMIPSATLLVACLSMLAACKDGGSSTDTESATDGPGTGSATDGPGTDGPSSATEDGTDGTPTTNGPGGDPTSDSDTDTGEPEGPHALGTILLGESHPSDGGMTSPSVSASFIPDVDGGGAGTACTETVAGCQISLLPDCGDNGCGADEYCGFDSGCKSKCQPICDAACAPDEVCYFPSPNTPGCKKIETFDAGALTFLGTPIPITLFPPYGFMSDDNAAPFAPGGKATVQASGASGAGFEKFEKEFTGTEFIQTSPKLDSLNFAQVFGNGDLPIQWTAGSGKVTITASVTSSDFQVGSVTCNADDAKGSFDLPRAALKAAIDGGDISALSISISRQRTDLYKDLTTKGQLTGVTVQPVGYLQIITSSTEYHAFQGCNPGEAVCDNECVDVQFDDANCGECGKTCPGEDTCNSGTCNGIDSCNACAIESQTGACKAENDACAADPVCKKFETCFTACDTQACVDECAMGLTQEDIDLYNAQISCLCDEACVGECAGLCN